MINENNKRISVVITKEEYSLLEKWGIDDNRKVSNLASSIIKDYIKRRREVEN